MIISLWWYIPEETLVPAFDYLAWPQGKLKRFIPIQAAIKFTSVFQLSLQIHHVCALFK